MPKLSATDAFKPAFERAKALLFPFKFGLWWRLALLGMLTGEFGGGGCNVNVPSGGGRSGGSQTQEFVAAPVLEKLYEHIWVIAGLSLLFFILFLLILYIGSVFRFILFDTILTGTVRIRAGWRQWREEGRRYFVLQLIISVVTLLVLLVVVGLPLGITFLSGLAEYLKQRLVLAALGITWAITATLIIVIAGAIVAVIAKDFLVPIMALERLPLEDAWRRLSPMLRREPGGFAGYLGLKLVMRLAAGLGLGMVMLILILMLLIPAIIVAVIVFGAGAAMNLAWTPLTITLAIGAGAILFVFLLTVMLVLHTPLAAFFPSYAIYFFAGRYAPLHDRLYPPPPPATAPASEPAPEPGPELPPEPA